MKNSILTSLVAALFALSGWHSRVATRDSALSAIDTAKWTQLFDGKDLNGWKHVGPGSMSVENGLIRGHGGMGLLYWTGGKLGNCQIKVVYKMKDMNDNSGVFIRI